MTRRMIPCLGVPVLVLSFTFVAVVEAGGQAPAARTNSGTPSKAAPKWTAPRTPWGDPDLEGTWNNGTITPLERARGAGEKALLSKQEEEDINAQSDSRAAADNRPKDKDEDLALAYDQFWWDRGAVDRADVAHHRSEGRTASGADRRGAEDAGRARRGETRARSCRLVGRSAAAGALHHVPRRAAAADRVQQ